MTIKTTTRAIQDWLLLVGDQYGVREAHHERRPNSSLKTEAKHFVFRFITSQTEPHVAVDCSTASGANDINIVHYMPFDRLLEIECWAENGMDILEAVAVSIHHPAAQSALKTGTGGIALKAIGQTDNQTEVSETSIEYIFKLNLEARVNTQFSLLRTNERVLDYTLSGTLESDSGASLAVEVADETT